MTVAGIINQAQGGRAGERVERPALPYQPLVRGAIDLLFLGQLVHALKVPIEGCVYG